MEINELCYKSWKIASEHGFWRGEMKEIEFVNTDDAQDWYSIPTRGVNLPEKVMLIVCELSELVEEMRKDMAKTDRFKEELADVWMRLADFTGYLEIDIEKEIKAKMDKNIARPIRHGKYF